MKRKLPLSTSASFYAALDNNPNGPAGLDWIQHAIQDMISGIMKQLTSNRSTVVMIGGASVTISGGNYSTTAGFVWYTGDAGGVGELFYLPAIPTTSMASNAYLNASVDTNTTPGNGVSGCEPTTYSDGTPRSPHVNRKIKLTPAASPSVGAYSAPTGSLLYGLITTLPDATVWVSTPIQTTQVSRFGQAISVNPTTSPTAATVATDTPSLAVACNQMFVRFIGYVQSGSASGADSVHLEIWQNSTKICQVINDCAGSSGFTCISIECTINFTPGDVITLRAGNATSGTVLNGYFMHDGIVNANI